MFRQIILLLFCFVIMGSGKVVKFDNYRVYSLDVKNVEQAKLLSSFELNSNDYDFWQSPSVGAKSDLMVPPHKIADFEDLAQSLNLNFTIKVKNVQKLIDNENSVVRPKTFGWDTYHNLNEIYAWLDEKLAAHPNILTGHFVGKSYLGRDIRAVSLSHNETNPWIFIESNIHAREWITSATATYVLDQLLTSQDPAVKDLAENFNWMIVPVFNVDGFEYSHKWNRLWRKTRQPHSSRLCCGTDLNRNFDYKWLEIGASANPCSNRYAGPKAFSEPETVQLHNFVEKLARKIKIYLAFHSYGQHFVFPFGNTEEPVENYEILMQIGNKTVEAIAIRSGTVYDYGAQSTIIYPTSGTSIDWFYDKLNIKHSYMFEFRDKGKYGFLLPSKQIIPHCLEILDGLIALIKEARALQEI